MSQSPIVRMAVLGSGSAGNCTIIECSNQRLLIDIGFSAKQTVQKLEQLDIAPETINGILLTQEHSDHTKGLDVFLRKRNIPVYVNALTQEALMFSLKSKIEWKIFQTGQPFSIGMVNVNTFATPHDAAEPVGFVFDHQTTTLGLVTDVGYVTQTMIQNLKSLDAIAVEANYDEYLLEQDTKRPWATKQRIASRHGHLSNKQTGEFIHSLMHENLQHIILLHLSSDCNNNQVATKTIHNMLAAQHTNHPEILCASQNDVSPWVEIRKLTPSVTTLSESIIHHADHAYLVQPDLL